MEHQETFISIQDAHSFLQCCIKRKDLQHSRKAQSILISSGLGSLSFLLDNLIRLFASCGSLIEANQSFDSVSKPSPYTWSAVILANVKLGQGQMALDLYQRMHLSNVEKDKHGYLAVLKACAMTSSLEQCRVIHCQIFDAGLQSDLVLRSTLVDTYAKCDGLDEAWSAFQMFPGQDVVLWNSMMGGFSYHGKFLIIMELFEEMKKEGIAANKVTFFNTLKASGSTGSLVHGRFMHESIIMSQLTSELSIGNTIIDMYAKCTSMEEAHKVFVNLRSRDFVTWTAMIAGYAQHENCLPALEFYELMLKEGIKPTEITYLSILKVCSSLGFIELGRLTHEQVITISGSNIVLGCALLDMYAKCGYMDEANSVFRQLPEHDMVACGAMIAGYAQYGECALALDCFERTLQDCLVPNAVTYSSILNACGRAGAMEHGRLIHGRICYDGLVSGVVVGNALVHMYAKCGSLKEAKKVFEALHNRDVISWTILISGYAQHGKDTLALELFERMRQGNTEPNEVTFSSVLKACSSTRSVHWGRFIHNTLIGTELELDAAVASALVDMYAKSGNFKEACSIFNSLPHQSLVSWNAIIGGYAQSGEGIAALDLFRSMQDKGIQPDKITYLGIMKACGSIGAIEEGKSIHEDISKKGILSDPVIGNALVDMYAKCGSLENAREVFDQLPNRDILSWGAMLSGYGRHGENSVVLELFERMQQEGIRPNEVIALTVLKACSNIGAIGHGRLIHGYMIRNKYVYSNVEDALGSILANMYGKCGTLDEACKMFNELWNPNVATWNAMIEAYARHGACLPAVQLFERMQSQGMKPNRIAFSSALKSCGIIGAIDQGRLIHDQLTKSGLGSNVAGTTLIDMYAKCGNLEDAHRVFDKLSNPDVISWNAIIGGYAQQGECVPALNLYKKMQEAGTMPNKISFLSILKACGCIGAIEQGRLIHKQVIEDTLAPDIALGNTLIDMYAKCGSLEESLLVFAELPDPSVISWTALISGHAYNGETRLARQYLEEMQKSGIKPNEVTLASILLACRHAGLVDEGHQYFMCMGFGYSISPDICHYNCLVDLLGRAGRWNEAEDLLRTNVEPNIIGWTSLLNACQMYGNVELGRQCFKEVIYLDPHCAPAYVLMANIYASADMAENAAHIEQLRKLARVRKDTSSWRLLLEKL